MDKTDLKQIANLLKINLGPIKKILDKHSSILNEHSKKLDGHSKKLNEHSRKLDALLTDVVTIQEEIKILPDIAAKLEKIDDHEERILELETISKF
jgi:chromosome segregation ATPase